MSPKELKSKAAAERKAAERGFAGREALVSGLYDPATAPASAQKILAAHMVKETVMALVRALNAKNALESRIESEAELVLSARAGKNAESQVVRKDRNLTTPEGIVSAALDDMNVRGEVKLVNRRNGDSGTYNIFSIKTDTGEERVVVKEEAMSGSDPVAGAKEYLQKQGFSKEVSGNGGVQVQKRRAADLVDLRREDLDSIKIAFQGNEDGRLNHFTYLEKGMESTIAVRTDLKGEALLGFLRNRIVQLHTSYNKRLSSEVAEAFAQRAQATSGIEMLQDAQLRKASKAIFMLSESFSEELMPEEYLQACSAVRSSNEFYVYGRDISGGVFTRKELDEFKEAFEMIDHPAHYIARRLNVEMVRESGELSEEDKAVLADTMRLHGDAKPGMPEHGLRAIADAYTMISGQETADWDSAKIERNYLRMVYRIRKAVISLGNCFNVIKDEKPSEEGYRP